MEQQWTYRPRSSAVLTGATWLVAVGLTTAEVVTGGAAAGLRALPGALLAALLGWAVFYRPHVVVDDAGVLVVNPLSTTLVPWAALIDVRTRFTCTLVTPRTRVEVFAAPGPGRHTAASATAQDVRAAGRGAADGRGAVSIGELPGSPSAVVARHVRERWSALVEAGRLEAGVADETPVVRRTHVRLLGSVVALAVTAVVPYLG